MQIHLAESDADVRACFPVMHVLRPHLTEASFVERVRRQRQYGYQLAVLHDGGEPQTAAGFRIAESLAWGRHVYVDDLVTREASQSQGYGQKMFDWLVAWAIREDCEQFHLDSGSWRHAAHRFYLMKRMDLTSFHFTLVLRRPTPA